MNPDLRDQLTGLSWALVIVGAVVSFVEWQILPADVFARLAPYTLGALALGVAGLWQFRDRAAVPGEPDES